MTEKIKIGPQDGVKTTELKKKLENMFAQMELHDVRVRVCPGSELLEITNSASWGNILGVFSEVLNMARLPSEAANTNTEDFISSRASAI